MNFKKLGAQSFFQETFKNEWKKNDKEFTRECISDKELNEEDHEKLLNIINEEKSEYFFKGIESFLEALKSIKEGFFSWSAVKLYYSLFYLTRVEFCMQNKIFVRHGRQLYLYSEKKFIKCKNSNDHEMTFSMIDKEHDYLSSNKIIITDKDDTTEEYTPYECLKKIREIANYQSKTFLEPNIPEELIIYFMYFCEKNMDQCIKFILSNKDSAVFQQEYCIVASSLIKIENIYKGSESIYLLTDAQENFLREKFSLYEEIILPMARDSNKSS